MSRSPPPRSTQTRSGGGDEYVGDAGFGKQRFERAGAGQLGLQMPQCREQIEIAENPAGFGTQRSGDTVRRGLAGLRRETFTDPVEQLGSEDGAHAAHRDPGSGPASTSRTDSAAWTRGERRPSRSPPRSSAAARPGCARIVAISGSPTTSATSRPRSPPGGRAAHDDALVRVLVGDPAGDPPRGEGGTHTGGDHQHGQVGGRHHRLGGRPAAARHVAHHQVARAADGVEHRGDGGGGRLGRGLAICGEHAESRKPFGHRIPQRPGGEPAAIDGQAGPADTRPLLDSREDVQPSAQGITVDEKCSRTVPEGGDGPCQGGRECGGAGAAAAAEYGDDVPTPGVGFGGGAEHREQFDFVVGQADDVFGPDGGGGLPVGEVGPAGSDQDDAASTGKLLRAEQGCGSVDHDESRVEPGSARRWHRRRADGAVGGGRHAVQARRQGGIVDEGQDVVHGAQLARRTRVPEAETGRIGESVDECAACG